MRLETRLRAAAILSCFAMGWPASAAFPQEPQRNLHIEGAVTGAIVESPEAMRVTTTIQCFCGTCVNQTLHECTCGLAARERERVAADLAAGSTPDTIIARYVRENGPQVRIVPEKRGLDLVGWSVPFAAALVGLLSLLLVLRTWLRRGLEAALHPRRPRPVGAPGTLADGPGGDAGSDRVYLERLERELKEFE